MNTSFAEARKKHKEEIQNKFRQNNCSVLFNQFLSISHCDENQKIKRKFSEIYDYELMLDKWNLFKNQNFDQKKIIHIDLQNQSFKKK